jgi:RNA polymerase sigma-70 factor, ECF subfamily
VIRVTRHACEAHGRCSDAKGIPSSQIDVNTHSDAHLVAAAARGNVDAFAELSRRYRDTYSRFAVRMLGDRDDAEDVMQSAFIRAYRALEQCRDPNRFGAWLYQIVANECRSFVIRRSRRDRRMLHDEIRLRDAPAVSTADGDDTLDDVQYALQQLDVDQREAFLMKHVEQLSYEEMAEITGDGISALKMRVKRACARLRELLEEVHDV